MFLTLIPYRQLLAASLITTKRIVRKNTTAMVGAFASITPSQVRIQPSLLTARTRAHALAITTSRSVRHRQVTISPQVLAPVTNSAIPEAFAWERLTPSRQP